MDDLKFTLTRYKTGNAGTFGRLTGQGLWLHTLELPWRDNQNDISCIPAGVYKVVHHSTTAYTNHYRLLNVPGREGILIHAGNTIKDIQGCILVGLKVGKLDGLDAVLESTAALNDLRARVGGRSFSLTIIDQTAK